MLISIDSIIVNDRIRKDYGNLEELAQDIKENGLINPPVVNRDNVLLAGERRLRACKLLGWQQVEVHQMDTRDAEHELNIEISENESRKEFSKSERVDYMKRLMRIESAKAEEREKAGVALDPVKNSAQGSGKTREIVASAFGVSHDTMKKEMSIVENKDLLDPSDFADWDEGRLSTNKTFLKLKARLKELEEENQLLEQENNDYRGELASIDADDETELQSQLSQTQEQLDLICAEKVLLEAKVKELEERKPETVEKEIIVHADQSELAEKDSIIAGLKEEKEVTKKEIEAMAGKLATALANKENDAKEIEKLKAQIEEMRSGKKPKDTPTFDGGFRSFLSALQDFNAIGSNFFPKKENLGELSKDEIKIYDSQVMMMEGLLKRIKENR